MGMNDMFNPVKADFSSLSEEIPDKPIFVSRVKHIALIDVNENGVEAGAVTSKYSQITDSFKLV